MDLHLHTTEKAEGFTTAQWAEWDRFLAASRPPSIHLCSAAIRAGLKSPKRAVRAARWTDAEGMLKGIAICEDSQAISQRLDDFLEGTAAFRWARNRLHKSSFGPRSADRTTAMSAFTKPEDVDEWGAWLAKELPESIK